MSRAALKGAAMAASAYTRPTSHPLNRARRSVVVAGWDPAEYRGQKTRKVALLESPTNKECGDPRSRDSSAATRARGEARATAAALPGLGAEPPGAPETSCPASSPRAPTALMAVARRSSSRPRALRSRRLSELSCATRSTRICRSPTRAVREASISVICPSRSRPSSWRLVWSRATPAATPATSRAPARAATRLAGLISPRRSGAAWLGSA